jgi:hypothetical protein
MWCLLKTSCLRTRWIGAAGFDYTLTTGKKAIWQASIIAKEATSEEAAGSQVFEEDVEDSI